MSGEPRGRERAARLWDVNFLRVGSKVLVSNSFAGTSILNAADFGALASGRATAQTQGRALADGGFFKDMLDFDMLMPRHYAAILKEWNGPHVHIISVAACCDHACLYCGAGASGRHSGGKMSIRTADAVMDFIFSLKVPELVIEFQGGEPLLNFRVVRHIIESSIVRAKKTGKKIHFSLVSNLAQLTAARLKYLAGRKVAICTSLDGPAFIHERNRKFSYGSSHAAAVRGIKAAARFYKAGKLSEPLNAICTVTRASLAYPERIVDEFLARGIKRVQLGPLEPLGRAEKNWDLLGYSAEEFLSFYSRALDHMIRLNKKGVEVYEKGALAFIKHILTGFRPRYQNLDLLYRLAYGWDGAIYGSDEARMSAAAGDSTFQLGHVRATSFKKIVFGPSARALLLSCFPMVSQPRCARCPFSAYCRVSPVYNYLSQGGFWGDMMTSQRCAVFRGVFKIIFEKMRHKDCRRVFEVWAEKYS